MKRLLLIAVLAVSLVLFGCTSEPQTQTFQGENGAQLKVTSMSGSKVSGEVTFDVAPSFASDSFNFVIAGGSLKNPINMPEEMSGASWQKKLDTKKYPNGSYRVAIFLGNEAGDRDTIRIEPFIISN